jgi:AAA ATPase domain
MVDDVPNPFRPTFGASPPVLAGREEVLTGFRYALEEGAGSPGMASLYVGPRGSGKTVVLNQIEDMASQAGWSVISENAGAGLVRRLIAEHLPTLLSRLDPDATSWRLSNVSAFGVGAGWTHDTEHQPQPGLRSQLTRLSDVLAARRVGVLLTIDEIHGGQRDELREVVNTIQHTFRENRLVAIAAAGLPGPVSERILNDEILTFFRRADRYMLGEVDAAAAAQALQVPIEDAGRDITLAALERAVHATHGYPYMIQLVGYHTWRQAEHQRVIDETMVARAEPIAVRQLGRQVHAPALAALSDGDRAFLLAMAEDDGPSRMRDIAARLGQSDAYTSQYRLRLIDAEVIHPVTRGYVEYTVPYLDDFLRREVGRDHRLTLGAPEEIEPPRRGISAPEAPGLDMD